MAYVFVKITDLYPHTTEQVAETDLLLKASPLIGNQFVSHTCQVKDFINFILNGDKRKITAHWIFTVHKDSLPSVQTTRFDTRRYWEEIIKNRNALNSFLNTFGDAAIIDGFDISQYSIANVDYVNRVFGYVFKSIADKMQAYFDSTFNMNLIGNKYIKSAVGDFVFSNTLAPKTEHNNVSQSDSNKDAMLRYYYGHGQTLMDYDSSSQAIAPNTKWKLHGKAEVNKRYVLTGANTNVEFNKQEPTGGSDEHDYALPSHTHTVDPHSHSASLNMTISSGKWVASIDWGNNKLKDGEEPHKRENAVALRSVNDTDVDISFSQTAYFNETTGSVSYEGNLPSTFNCIQPTMYFYIWERVQ